MKCRNCGHDLAQHVIPVDRCNHPAGDDAHCTCPEYVLPEDPRPAASAPAAQWVAPCPHCEANAEWNSRSTGTTVLYEMNCPDCGPIKWLAGKP